MSKSLAASIIFLTSVFTGHAPAVAEEAPQPVAQTGTDYNFPACFDHRGTPVRYLRNDIGLDSPWVFNFGTRYLDQRNIEDPVIFYDPDLMQTQTKVAIDFTLAHECYHFSSGDTYRAYEIMNTRERPTRDEMQEQEDAADCNAAHRMRDEFGYTTDDLQTISPLLKAIGASREISTRIPKIIACYQNNTPT